MSQIPRPELAGMLFQEIEGYIPKIENSIALLLSCPTDQDALKEVHRLFHNIKGAASQVAFSDLSNSAAICETMIATLMESSTAPTKSELEFLGTINGHIRNFCALNDKTSQAEQFLFATTLSFFRKMMEQSGPENLIILPEHIHTLLQTDENHAPAGDGFRDDTDSNLQPLHLECLASLRSIIPLLQELTDCSKQMEMKTLSPGILQQITSALSTLALCSCASGLKAQEQLISSFLDILETFRQCPDVSDRTILGVLQEFISYLDLVVSLPPQEGESAIVTIQSYLAQFVHLFRDVSFLPKPFSDETAGHLTERNGYVGSDADDQESNFLQNLPSMECDGDRKSESTDPDEIELFEIFQTECAEHLQAISAELDRLNINDDACTDITDELRESLNRMRISVHTLKGAAAMTGFSHIAFSAYAFEKFLHWMHGESQDISGADVAVIHRAAECLHTLSKDISQTFTATANNNTKTIEQYLLQRIQATPGKQPESAENPYPAFQSAQTPDNTDTLAVAHDYIDFSDVFTGDALFGESLAIKCIKEMDTSDVITDITKERLLPSGYDSEQLQELQDEELELLVIFQSECDDHLFCIHGELNLLAVEVRTECAISTDLRESIARMRREVYTLKGAAAMTGFDYLATCAHAVEDLLDWLHDDASNILPGDVALIAEAIDTLELASQLMNDPQFQNGKSISQKVEEHLQQRATSKDADHVTAGRPESQQMDSPQEDGSALPVDTSSIRLKTSDLEELVNIEEKLVVSRGFIENLLNTFSQSLNQLATAKDSLRRISRELDISLKAQSLYRCSSASPLTMDSAATPGNSERSEINPIERDRHSQLNLISHSLNDISIDVNAIHSQMTSMASGLQGQVSRQQLPMAMMQEKFLRIRMIPLSNVSRKLFHTVRQTTKLLDKDVQLTITGKDVLMDRFVWSKAIDPLLHLLRNAIEHGIETASARESANKPAAGRITLDAAQHGRIVVLKISDDGQGIDTERLRKTLIAENSISAGTAVSDQDLLPYLFRPSVSTRDSSVSQISGRGLGLGVVSRNIQKLRGKVQIINSPGEGVTFELHIPLTLSVNPAVIIELGSKHFAVLIQDITEVRKFSGAEILEGETPQVLWNGKPIPLMTLASFLNVPSSSASESSSDVLTLVIDNGKEHIAMRIDRVNGQREVVITDLGSRLRHVKGISGVTLTGEGVIIPILNLKELFAVEIPTIIAPTTTQIAPAAPQTESLKVMIIDDSISVRYSITRLVQGRSWHAYQAVDGIDALEKLEALRPDVIVLDIEMPRMNGYEFMSILRNSEDNSSIPVIMLTSRSSATHRKKAEKLGVNHYLTKPFHGHDFIQLLSTIETNR